MAVAVKARKKAVKSGKKIKYVYFFGGNKTEGNASMKNLIGGKGSNLAEMALMGIPVPPGFTITTEACIKFYENNKKYPQGMMDQVADNLRKLESVMGKKLGDPKDPLLVSVRSGARVSMPGMMDTVLNLGLNDTAVKGLAEKSGNERFAYDAYRRFCQMFGDVVLDVAHAKFEEILHAKKTQKNVKLDTELDTEDLKDIVSEYKALIKKEKGFSFPEDPIQQLKMAIDAVFGSWNNERAIKYRNLNNIPHSWGTAVNIQTMVYGNLGEDSGTGVAFTRDPGTGAKKFYGEYLMNAQGEDVVAGIRTPHPIDDLKKTMPRAYLELVSIYKKLELHYKDMQDIEFTIQEKKLYMLQTRNGKRTAQAALKIAVDMVSEGLITKEAAVLRVQPSQLDQMLHPMIDPKAKISPIAKGLPASPGAAVGKAVFTADRAEELAKKGEKVVLVRLETSPDDIGGMAVAQGILTAFGGMTSHAAVVGRGMGKCCVVGCNGISVHVQDKYFTAKDKKIVEGDYITLNGNTGEVILGQVNL
ncbi:MAG: pyruvate, phosphate dikinase, partial [Candidatus Omnitrophota bacterium]